MKKKIFLVFFKKCMYICILGKRTPRWFFSIEYKRTNKSRNSKY